MHISFCLFYSIMLSNECIAFTQCIFSFAFSMVSCYQMNASLEQSCTYILFASILLISCIVYVVYARIVSHRIASSRIKPRTVESNWIEIRSLYLNFSCRERGSYEFVVVFMEQEENRRFQISVVVDHTFFLIASFEITMKRRNQLYRQQANLQTIILLDPLQNIM